MRIKCLTRFLDGRTVYELDDQCTVSDEDGTRFCAAGWAEDMDGKVETGEPTGGAATLQTHNMKSGHTTKTAGS